MCAEKPEYIFEYRGKQVPVYLDEPGQQFYIIWEGHELGLGSYNVNYEEDIKYLIDLAHDKVLEEYGINMKIEQEFVNWE